MLPTTRLWLLIAAVATTARAQFVGGTQEGDLASELCNKTFADANAVGISYAIFLQLLTSLDWHFLLRSGCCARRPRGAARQCKMILFLGLLILTSSFDVEWHDCWSARVATKTLANHLVSHARTRTLRSPQVGALQCSTSSAETVPPQSLRRGTLRTAQTTQTVRACTMMSAY